MENWKRSAFTGIVNEACQPGLTKREYFAGLAMQGLLSANAMYQGRTNARDLLCQDAIAHSDELLRQLDKLKIE